MFSSTQFKNNLPEAIVSTIAFFDLFDYPLTAYEIFKYSDGCRALRDIIEVLDQEIDSRFRGNDKESGNDKSGNSQPVIQQKNGFYFLTGREEIIVSRQKRHNYTQRKIKIARRFSRWLRLCPFVRSIAVANLIGDNNLREQSDIDFFIITAPRRLWLSRLYCAGLAKILRRRPTADNKKDKICLSFYVSAAHLNLDDLRLPGADPYFDYWRRGLVLLYNKGGVYGRFLKENGLAAAEAVVPSSAVPEAIEKKSRLSIFLNFLEKISRLIQLKIMPAALKTAANNSDGVIISDTVLKLYLSDRRREYAKKYGDKINEIIKENG